MDRTIDVGESQTEEAEVSELQVGTADLEKSIYSKIEVVWPGKDTVGHVEQSNTGQWQLSAGAAAHRVFPLVDIAPYPEAHVSASSLAIAGDRLAALRTLNRFLGRSVRLAYVDAPRIGIDDVNASFRGDASLVYSSWLSVMRAHMLAVEPLLRRDGVIVLHVGDTEAAFARMLGDEYFGAQQRVGTIVWQRAYAPRNMKGMREFTSTHDNLIIYAKQRDALPPVGLRSLPNGYSNPDDDPRGPWKAEHKGAKARRAKSDFDTYIPPYRWRLVEGRLPDGIWRLSPLTGVIWGTPREAGRFPLTVQVADADGQTQIREFVLEVLAEGIVPPLPELPWIFEEISTSGDLWIETERLPAAVIDKEYSAACLGAGGRPFRAPAKRPGSGRYWEFADDTLLKAYQKDAVYLGRAEPTAIPHPKAYAPAAGELVVENQQTWWPGRIQDGKNSSAFAGYTEDATKHLKALKELALIKKETSSAKPEHLLARLVDIFTDKDDLVLEVFGTSGDMAAVALKRSRRFLLLAGSSDRDSELFVDCARPRLCAVIDGKDRDLHDKVTEIRMRADAYIPFDGGGAFSTARLGSWLIERHKRDDLARLNLQSYSDPKELGRVLLATEGYLPAQSDMTHGVSLRDGTCAAVVIPSDEYLTAELASEWVERLMASYQSITLYYFRCSSEFDPSALPAGVSSRRVPFELGV
jgi:hypothetical protein